MKEDKQTESGLQVVDRRRHERFISKEPLNVEISIDSFKGKKTNSKIVKTFIKNLSEGGLRFISLYPYPKHPSLILSFSFKIGEQLFQVKGGIVWECVISKEAIEYGVEFYIDEYTQSQLRRALTSPSFEKTDEYPMSDDEMVYVLKEIEKSKAEIAASKNK